MVGILVSFWNGLFSGAMLVSGSVISFRWVGSTTNQLIFFSLPETNMEGLRLGLPPKKNVVSQQAIFQGAMWTRSLFLGWENLHILLRLFPTVNYKNVFLG